MKRQPVSCPSEIAMNGRTYQCQRIHWTDSLTGKLRMPHAVHEFKADAKAENGKAVTVSVRWHERVEMIAEAAA